MGATAIRVLHFILCERRVSVQYFAALHQRCLSGLL